VRKPLAIRLPVLPLILAVFALGTQAVAHSHSGSHDEDHCTCQVCHVGHIAIPQPASHAQIKASVVSARFAPDEISSPLSESPDVVSIPRAPPPSA
jgi:hypothetical protein